LIKAWQAAVYVSYTTSKYVGPIDMGIEPNPTKLKECYDEVMNQISLWAR
jgi:zinc protease